MILQNENSASEKISKIIVLELEDLAIYSMIHISKSHFEYDEIFMWNTYWELNYYKVSFTTDL